MLGNFDKEFHRYLWHPLYDNDPSLWEPKTVVARAKAMHANAIHWHANGSSSRSNYVFYQSPTHPVFPLIGKRDLLREMVEECHRNGIYLVAYINCHWAPKEFFQQHPDWLQLDANGKPFGGGYGQGAPMCANNADYREQWIRPIVEQITSGYDIDAIFLDGPSRRNGSCYCPECRRIWQELHHGVDIPTAPDWNNPDFLKFIQFNYRSECDFVSFVRDIARKNKPGLPVYKNGAVMLTTWFNGISPMYNADVADVISAEAFMYYIRPLDVPYWKSSSVAKYLRGASRGKPTIDLLSYGQKSWHVSAMSADQQQYNIACSVANGAYPFTTIEDFTMRDGRSFDAVGEIYGFIERHQEEFAGARSQANIALLYSQWTSDYYERGVITAAGGTHDYYCKAEQTYGEEVCGFIEALMHSGLPFDMICDKNLNAEDLAKYDVIVLPNSACLSDAAVAALKAHVAAGKGLVASFHASQYDELGRKRPAPALAAELGIAQVKDRMKPMPRDYMKVVAAHAITAGIPVGLNVVIPKDNLDVAAEKSAQALTYAMEPLPFSYAPTGKRTDSPGVIINERGGRCVYFSGLIGAHYNTYGIPDHQNLMFHAVEWAMKKPVCKVVGSPNIEVTLYAKGKRRYVHLINYTSRPQLPIQHIESVRNIEVRLPWSGARLPSCRALWSGKNLPVEKSGDEARINLDEMRIYEVIAVE